MRERREMRYKVAVIRLISFPEVKISGGFDRKSS